jgi:uncharacterized membrane protein
MTALSALVATAGLLLDSPAIVVGSMVIAPLVGASLMASVGLTLGDRAMVRSGVRSQVAGLALVVCAAAAFGLALRTVQFVPPVLDVTVISQISSRTTPGLLSVVVALCAGAVGAFGLATEPPVSLVGSPSRLRSFRRPPPSASAWPGGCRPSRWGRSSCWR